MQAGEYLAVISAQRNHVDGYTVTGHVDCVLTLTESTTRYAAMRSLCQILDEKYFIPTFGSQVITDNPPMILFLYIEPN